MVGVVSIWNIASLLGMIQKWTIIWMFMDQLGPCTFKLGSHKEDFKSQKRWSVPTLVTLIFVIVKTTVHPNSCWLYIGSNTVWVWFAPEILITSFLLTQDRSKLWEESEIRLMSTLNLEQQKFLEVVFRLLYLRLRTLLAKSHFKNKKLRQKEDHGVLHINKNMRSGT